MLGQLPAPLPQPQQRVFRRRFVDQIRHPGVPARFDLRGVVFAVFVVDPAGAHCEAPRRRVSYELFVRWGLDVFLGGGGCGWSG